MMKLNVFHYLPEEAKAIRIAVFCEEQGFQEEFDELDCTATHLVAYEKGIPVGTCRFTLLTPPNTYLIGRIAVSRSQRGKGIGGKLVREAEKLVLASHTGSVVFHIGAQVQAIPFYAGLGYTPVGERYMDEHVEHQGMEKTVASP